MPSNITCLGALVFSFSAFGQTQAVVGTLSGAITDSQGSSLAGAVVSYQRVYQVVYGGPHGNQPFPAPGEAIMSGHVTTGEGGAFDLASLPVGDYLLCATVPGAPYLDPCSWQGSVRVTVVSGAVTQEVLALHKGVFLKVRISDTKGLLPQVVDGPFGGGLSVGVIFGKGAYLGAQNTGVDSGGRDYQMIVPAGMPLNVWVQSGKVALIDSAGEAIAASGSQIPFQAIDGLDQTFSFTVSGPVARAQ